MKKRIISIVLVLTLVLSLFPISALAASPRLPIYLGYIEVDYMAEEILKEIPTAGKSAKDQIQAVYDWIIANCKRSGWDGTYYFDESVVAAQSNGEFAYNCTKQVQSGKLLVRRDLESEGGFTDTSSMFIPFDSNYYVATYAYEMMLTRTGNCAHYASLLTVLLGHLGFDCRVFHGEFVNMDGSQVEHTWNYILVDGQYYWADVRIDQSVGGHNYFMISDTDDWAGEHIWPNENYSNWLAKNAAVLQQGFDDAAIAAIGPWGNCSAWAEEYMERAAAAGLIPDVLIAQDQTQAISRAEFAAVAVQLYETLEGSVPDYTGASPFSDTSDPDVLRAYSLGVVNGMGDGTFAPNANLTREQAVTMLGRVYELSSTGAVGSGASLPQGANHFTDHSSILAYAKNYVYFFVGQSIVEGMGNGTFSPKSSMTREQALKIAVETAEKLG